MGEGLEPTVLTSLVGIAGFHEDNIVEIDSTEGRTVTDDPIRHFIKCHGEPCIDQTGTKRGRLRGEVLLFGGVSEGRVPPVEVVGEFAIQDPGADLEQETGANRGRRMVARMAT